MADQAGGPDWERGSDGKWYAPGVLSGAGWWRAGNGVWYPGPSPRGAPPRVDLQPQPPAGPSFWDRVKSATATAWAAFRRLPPTAQVIVATTAGALLVVLLVVSAVTSSDPDRNEVTTAEVTSGTADEVTSGTVDDADEIEPAEPTTTTTEGSSAQIDLVDRTVSVEDVASVEISGETAPGTTVTAQWQGGETTTTAGPEGAFTLTIDGLDTEGVLNVSLSSEAPGGDTDEASLTITRTVSENNFKFFTRRIPYDELVRDPDALIGETVNYRARVLQYDSRTTTAAMLVYVTEEDFGLWTDNIPLTLDPALGANVDNDDLIDLWGTVTGSQTYDTAIGGSNTVPTVEVRYMNLVEKQ